MGKYISKKSKCFERVYKPFITQFLEIKDKNTISDQSYNIVLVREMKHYVYIKYEGHNLCNNK